MDHKIFQPQRIARRAPGECANPRPQLRVGCRLVGGQACRDDVELRRGMWDYLTGLSKSGLTILLTTHYLEEAEQLAKHVAIINQGEIIARGTMDEILALHDPSGPREGFRGGRLEEVFLKLTSQK